MTVCFLRTASDYLEDAVKFKTIGDAKADFEATARELDRYGQHIEAAIHIAPTLAEVVEYPDYVLSIGPKGGLVCERT